MVLLIDARRGVMDTDLAVMELLDKSRGLLCPGADQDRRTEAGRAREASSTQAAAEARKHTAALAEIFATSSPEEHGAGRAEGASGGAGRPLGWKSLRRV